MMKLSDVITRIPSLQEDDVIFAKKPWAEDSIAKIGKYNQNCQTPDYFLYNGFHVFLEKSTIDEILPPYLYNSFNEKQILDFLIYYAEYDAYPDWANELASHLWRS